MGTLIPKIIHQTWGSELVPTAYPNSSKVTYRQLTEDIYILDTFGSQMYDGLRQVFQRISDGKQKVAVETPFVRKKILVSGIPFLYTDYLSRQNLNICSTTFETTQLPDSWVNALNHHYHHCIVPNACVKKYFEQSGVRIPIHIVHQGFTRHKRTTSAPSQEVFRVGFLGVPQLRKNLNALFEACQRLKQDVPSLKLSVHAATLYEEIDPRRLKAIRDCSWVEWTEGALSEAQIADWYSQLSCYVFPSSGEGWSFTPRESLYMAIPTIISDIPSHYDLLGEGYCKAIPNQGWIPARHEIIDNAARGYATYGMWHKMAVADILDAIKDVYENYQIYLSKAKEGAQWIRTKWQNEDHQHQMKTLLEQLEWNHE